MRYINMQTWSRRQHFEFFSTFDRPHFGMCANVDLTEFYSFVKLRDYSINLGIVYIIARTANAIPEFRYRIREGDVVEHEIIHPSTTVLTDDDLFNFCPLDYFENFSDFEVKATERIAYLQGNPSGTDHLGRDDLIYLTAIPWVSFTKFMHPMPFNPVDSVPRFAWGKFFKADDRMLMPLDVQAHHALMDGLHMGRFFEQVQDDLQNPGLVLAE